MLRRWMVIWILLLPLGWVQAQEAKTVQTLTGRLTLQLPEGWVSRWMPEEEELLGLDSETLVLGTSNQVIDQYLGYTSFDGTVVFLSAYPYSVYTPSVRGFPAAMMTEVTPLTSDEITLTRFAGFPGAEYLYTDSDQGYFIWEVLFDTGELTYRATTYSTRMDDYDLVSALISGAVFTPTDSALKTDQSTRTIQSTDERLHFEIPESWLFWNEGDNTLSFASSGTGYLGLSYAFKPQHNDEIAFLAQRFIKSALREGELNADGSANLPTIATRLLGESNGIQKNNTTTVSTWNNLPRLDVAWLVQGEQEAQQTRTILLDGGDVVYFIQAQYAARNSAAFQPLINAIFDSLTYTPTVFIDTSTVGLEPGQTAPEFTLPLLDGGQASLSDYAGKLVLMNMWASWCGPCHQEVPHLQNSYEQYDGRFEILAVNVGESEYEANGFRLQYALSFPVLLDNNEQVAQLYGLEAYPTTYIIGRDGVILDVIRGSFTEQGLQDILALYVGQ